MALADVGVVYRSALVILSEHKPRLTERPPVHPEHLQCLGRDGHEPVLAALSATDKQLAAVEVDVVPL